MNENTTFSGSGSKTLLDTAATTANEAIRSSQRAAHKAVDRFADGAEEVRAQTGAALGSLASSAEHLTERSAALVRERTEHLREQSRHAAESTRHYIRDEPMKSVLIAAAAGAVLMALLNLFGRSHRRH